MAGVLIKIAMHINCKFIKLFLPASQAPHYDPAFHLDPWFPKIDHSQTDQNLWSRLKTDCTCYELQETKSFSTKKKVSLKPIVTSVLHVFLLPVVIGSSHYLRFSWSVKMETWFFGLWTSNWKLLHGFSIPEKENIAFTTFRSSSLSNSTEELWLPVLNESEI